MSLFTLTVPVSIDQEATARGLRYPDAPPVAEVIAGGTVRAWCQGVGGLCGPVGVFGAEPGDLVMVEISEIGRADGGVIAGGHLGILALAPSPAREHPGADAGSPLERPTPVPDGDAHGAESVRAGCHALTPRTQILLPVHAPGARISVGDLHFPERDACRGRDGWVDLRVHLTKRGMERFRVTEPVIMPLTTSSLDGTVAGVS